MYCSITQLIIIMHFMFILYLECGNKTNVARYV